MSGRLDKGQLEELVASGEIDTVVAAFTDMQGRLIGKRCTGRYFLERCTRRWHACNYLLGGRHGDGAGPGLQGRPSWEKGYGDFVIRPDLGTLRRIPWLPGTALVLVRRHSTMTGTRTCRTARAPSSSGSSSA